MSYVYGNEIHLDYDDSLKLLDYISGSEYTYIGGFKKGIIGGKGLQKRDEWKNFYLKSKIGTSNEDVVSKYITCLKSFAVSYDKVREGLIAYGFDVPALHDINAINALKDYIVFDHFIQDEKDTIADNASETSEIDVSILRLYKDMPVRIQDLFRIKSGVDISDQEIALTDQEHNKIAIGRIIKKGEDYYGIFDKFEYENIGNNEKLMLFISANRKKKLLDILLDLKNRNTANTVYKKQCEVRCAIPEETDKILCVDFGTSNTTAGSYGILNKSAEEPELVKFCRQDTMDLDERFPTVVYVEDCSDPDSIKYLFGYDANIRVREKNFDVDASVFYEIKRWMTDVKTEEKIRDEEGNTCTVKRGDIIKAYLEYVIREAEYTFKVRFRNLHFSAPAKMKSSFLITLSDLLPDYEILKDELTIDEGVAIVYNYISERQKNVEEKEEGSIMIIDCGGGTTDYAKCNYEIIPREENTTLRLETQFENGNADFGGNSITYRILQFLKIRLANHYAADKGLVHEINKLIPYTEDEILTQIDKAKEDKNFANTIYDKLQENYDAAEDIIPTRFAVIELENEKRQVKQNYYYLWQIAEYIKTEFYRNGDKIAVSFKDNASANNIDMNEILSMYSLYIRERKGLVKKEDHPNIEINLEEIRKLIYGDIYEVLNDMLSDFDQEKNTAIKLSGQSCRINIFNQLMREFITGKTLRKAAPAGKNGDQSRLKLDCVRGCINFVIDRHNNDIDPKITVRPPQLIYTVSVQRKKKIDLLSSDGESMVCDFSCFNVDTTKNTVITVTDNRNKIEQTFSYEFPDEENYKQINDDALGQIFANSLIGEKSATKLVETIQTTNTEDKIGDKDAIFLLTLPSSDSYGFIIYAVKKIDDGNKTSLYIGPATHRNYENNIATQKYFEGNM